MFAIRRKFNPSMTIMKTNTELKDLAEYEKNELELVNATRYSVKLRDILNTIEADRLVLKIDIEGYECKVLTSRSEY